MGNKTIGKVIGITFIAFSYILFIAIDSSYNLFDTILLCWISYCLAFLGVGLTIPEMIEKGKKVDFIYNKILSMPVIGLIYYQYLVAPILTLIMFLSFYTLPSIWILLLGERYPFISQYSQGLIYFLSLLSVLFFAYKSNVIMRLLLESFKTKLFRRHLERYTDSKFTRLYTYILMILIYVIYNFVTFSNINLNWIPSELLSVVKEVFVTFVAVDTLLQILFRKNINREALAEYKSDGKLS